MDQCPKCKAELKKGIKLNSGNTMFQEYTCPVCGFKTTRAIGVNK